MKRNKLLFSLCLMTIGALATTRAGRSCTVGGVTCNTLIGTACDGNCDGDVCEGTQTYEYSCSDGSIQFVE